MLDGTLAGGVVAQATNLGVPYLLRAALLGLTFVVAFMLDARRRLHARDGSSLGAARSCARAARLARSRAPQSAGALADARRAVQRRRRHLRVLRDAAVPARALRQRAAYAIAGLAAAIVAGTQIVGGLSGAARATALRAADVACCCRRAVVSAAALALIGLVPTFWVALTSAGGLGDRLRRRYAGPPGVSSTASIPSEQRATVLSSDNLLASAGGVVAQPALGRVADAWSYATSYVVGAGVELLALPFILLARRERAASDSIPDSA